MLLVGQKVSSEEVVSAQKSFNIDDFIWPHGITPPLHHARKRRFRRRVNRRTIESVEQEVERLLEQDARQTTSNTVCPYVVDPLRLSFNCTFQRSWKM